MTEIRILPEDLERVANNTEQVRLQFQDTHQRLNSEIENLQHFWSGVTQQQFYQDFYNAKGSAFSFTKALGDIEEDLRRIAEKFRIADSMEVELNDAGMCGRRDPEEQMWRDIAGELSGEYDFTKAVYGVDPSTGEEQSWLSRTSSGLMFLAGALQVGKLGKAVKVGKIVDKAEEAKDAAKAAERLREQRQVQIGINKEAGAAFEKEVKEIVGERNTGGVVEQITMASKKSGTKVRMDFIGYDKDMNKIELVEAKGSLTAPLTKAQKKGFPQIEEEGAIVRGKGKPPFTGGTEIPPTKIEIIRKE